MLTSEQEDRVREIAREEIDILLDRLIGELDRMSIGASATRDVSAVSRISLRGLLSRTRSN